MLAGLPVLVGVQLLVAFLNYDVNNVPRIPLHQRLLPPEPPVSKKQKVPRNPVGLPASVVSR